MLHRRGASHAIRSSHAPLAHYALNFPTSTTSNAPHATPRPQPHTPRHAASPTRLPLTQEVVEVVQVLAETEVARALHAAGVSSELIGGLDAVVQPRGGEEGRGWGYMPKTNE